MKTPTPRYVSLNQLCRKAGCHYNSGSRYIRSGDLQPAQIVSRVRLFDPADAPKLEKLVAEGRARRFRKA